MQQEMRSTIKKNNLKREKLNCSLFSGQQKGESINFLKNKNKKLFTI